MDHSMRKCMRPLQGLGFDDGTVPQETVMEMEIRPQNARPTKTGLPEWFTGEVTLEPLFEPHPPARAAGVMVRFAARARTAWHTHPLGQTLIVTRGRGRVQVWGEPIREVGVGDVIWFPPGVKHWHGAGPEEEFSHLAVHEALDGRTADWLEPVSDAEYEASR